MADADCLKCHEQKALRSKDGRTMFVDAADVQHSRHAKVSCAQCHSEVNVSRQRPCETLDTRWIHRLHRIVDPQEPKRTFRQRRARQEEA